VQEPSRIGTSAAYPAMIRTLTAPGTTAHLPWLNDEVQRQQVAPGGATPENGRYYPLDWDG
jgi:hypothetical protein